MFFSSKKNKTKATSLTHFARLLTVSSHTKFQFPDEVSSEVEKTGFTILNNDNQGENVVSLLVLCSDGDKDSLVAATRSLRMKHPTAFMCVWHPDATEDAFFRQACFGLTTEGANMVSFDLPSLSKAISLVRLSSMRSGDMVCPYCNMDGFSEDELWYHNPLYHVNCVNHESVNCPLCRKSCHREQGTPYPVHLRNKHGPCGRGEIQSEHHTGLFAIVVCRRPSDGKYLMVQEFASSGFWMPGGQLDAGESLRAAVERETIEEAGVSINLLGVLNVMIQSGGRWRRFVFYAEPKEESTLTAEEGRNLPKTLPDYESTGACWVTLEEVNRGRSPLMRHHKRGSLNSAHDDGDLQQAAEALTSKQQLKLRDTEPLEWFNYVENGGAVLPLEIPPEHAKTFRDVPF
jgi:8-oxo-dGTP pyrophosphatase MutT (NUDIX family)